MARISSYPKHIPVQPEDYWIGTRASNLMTRNFTAKAVGEYINVSGDISMATCMLFKFKVTNAGPGDVTGVPSETPFANITSLQINTLDVSDQDTVGFLEYIVGTEIIISEQNKISTFGHYTIDSYTQIDDTAFYTMNLSFIGGSGVIEHDMQYNICSFVLAGEDSNTTYDLSSSQSGADSNIMLIGQNPESKDTVTLSAGNNVTITDTGSNILIDVVDMGDKNYVHDQPVASITWTVQHNLDKFPSCTMVLSTGQQGYGDVTFIDENNLTITFAGAESGKAYIN
tara:strand:+ start:81 stop:935 length:855 start_codon:yes stop_codon:yes gene_type:complete